MSEKEKTPVDVELTLPGDRAEREDASIQPRRSTTRVELWAFYVYYIVSGRSSVARNNSCLAP